MAALTNYFTNSNGDCYLYLLKGTVFFELIMLCIDIYCDAVFVYHYIRFPNICIYHVYLEAGCAHLRPGAVRRMSPGADRRMSPGRRSADEPWAQFDR